MADSKKREERGFVAGLFIVALLLCVGTPAYVVYRQLTDPDKLAGMEQAATAYLDAMRDGDYATAYGLTCAEERDKYPLEEWTRYYREPDIDSYRITEVKIVDQSETPRLYHVRAELRLADGRTQLWHYNLSHEGDDWRVCYDTAVSG